MDPAVLRQRRAARKRQLRRRRQVVLAGMLVAVIAIVVALSGLGGADPRPASDPLSTPKQVAVAPVAVAPPAARPRAPALPGAHRGPREPVAILMYHVIGDLPPGAPNASLWVAPAAFSEHVRALRRAGYHAVTLRRVWNAWHHHGLLPSKPVVLSFDDGYLGQVHYALPALAMVGWPGVLNLKLGNLADMGGTKAVKRMVRAGWEIDSHTITHPDLTTIGARQLHDELVVSRERLKRYFGVPVSFFCYPSGRYDATVIAAVKRAGYLAATTTQLGWASPGMQPFELPRVRVDRGMSGEDVLARLRDTRPAAAA